MSVKDVIKKSVYEALGGGTGLELESIVVVLLVALVIGIYIYLIYKIFSKSSFYSKELNVSLACMPVIVAAIMLAMQANLLVSLGMVGALSIVRFRTAIKNPLDLIYFFWGISAGIISGVGLHILCVVLCIMVTAIILVLQYLPGQNKSLLIVKYEINKDIASDIRSILTRYDKHSREMSRTLRGNLVEVMYEITCKEKDMLSDEIKVIIGDGVVSLVDYNGEFRTNS